MNCSAQIQYITKTTDRIFPSHGRIAFVLIILRICFHITMDKQSESFVDTPLGLFWTVAAFKSVYWGEIRDEDIPPGSVHLSLYDPNSQHSTAGASLTGLFSTNNSLFYLLRLWDHWHSPIKACFKGKSPLTALRCSVALKQTQTDNKRIYSTQESQTDRGSDLTGSGNKE